VVSVARPEGVGLPLAAGLGVVQLGSRLRALADDSSPPVPPAAPVAAEPPPAADSSSPVVTAPAAPVARPPLTITTPVRGGQVTYARGTDLVVVSSVNPGAQVIADGSVQIWGPLRGRALAGAQGRKDARILCLALEAELVSVAGEYLMAEEIPNALRGKPAQIYLEGERVRIGPL
jgi:septum site-determining protein MinC